MELVGLKVRIGLTKNGHAAYPDFRRLEVIKAAQMDWSKYVDMHGGGWAYGMVGHQEASVDSPQGEQWGVLLVPDVFATEAEAAHPDTCTILTEAETTDFHDNESKAAEQDDESVDADALLNITAVLGALQALPESTTAREQVQLNKLRKALDPSDRARGVTKNKGRFLADRLADMGAAYGNATSSK